MKFNEAVKRIIRSNRERVGIMTNRELVDRIGMKLPTFKNRLKDPGSWIGYELRELARVTDMPDEDLLFIIKGKE